ncbi:fumarylacetoacetate hydrolase family protein [Actinomycetospora straminea]|uniref:2-keto-4-pentenoate hydratase/2-oxohepta-3-ene-1,7-dioic acid hydratase in catechol pathway n=1 Tax=Actinomycetospora straminea TaxID=663607 RepID=A0ABP9DWE4_9PSEU|nr:fumarylacetoacetate hydrolase family protein [Actinomycetospora straminea]MDD7935137.1 fumarylacetoacetate hydrolase family protein [Actinomycetospora straminea]
MRWVTYDAGDGARTGLLDGDSVRGLAAGVSLVALLGDDGEALAEAGGTARRDPAEVRALDDVRLLAPIPRPPSVRDGLCFLEHLRGCYRALGRPAELPDVWSQTPAFYFANPAAVVGPYDDVPIAPGSRLFDLELEIGAVVGRGGRDLHPDTAEDHVVGFTFFNDWTARDHQMRDMAQGIGMGKGKDSAITLGPALVTVDELEAHRGERGWTFEVSATVNDRRLAKGSLADMDWSFGELLAFLSRGTDLRPGDVIGSGTVPGGCLLEHVDVPDPTAWTGWLQPGDVVALASDALGETRQVVRPAPPVTPLRTGF